MEAAHGVMMAEGDGSILVGMERGRGQICISIYACEALQGSTMRLCCFAMLGSVCVAVIVACMFVNSEQK